jgi:hypothetical protein
MTAIDKLAHQQLAHRPSLAYRGIEVDMLVQARRAVLESGYWVTSAEAAALMERNHIEAHARLYKWKEQKRLFSIHCDGLDLFPRFGLSLENKCRPYSVLTRLLKLFDGRRDDWGLAFWFTSANSFLAGKRPQDLLASHPDWVIAAAIDDVQAVAHG